MGKDCITCGVHIGGRRSDDDAWNEDVRCDDAWGEGAWCKIHEDLTIQAELNARVVKGSVAVDIPRESVVAWCQGNAAAVGRGDTCSRTIGHGACGDHVAACIGDAPWTRTVTPTVKVFDRNVFSIGAGAIGFEHRIGQQRCARKSEGRPLTHGEFVFFLVWRPLAHWEVVFLRKKEGRVEDLKGQLGEVIVGVGADLSTLRNGQRGAARQCKAGRTQHAVVVECVFFPCLDVVKQTVVWPGCEE